MSTEGLDALAIYERLREQLVPMLRSLTPEQAWTIVPSCPEWSVRDVIAHISGLVTETLAGVPLPRGSDAATKRQVADRSDLTLAAICDEWTNNADAFAAFAQQDPAYVAALASDLVVHALDIAEVLEAPIEVDPQAITLVAARYGQALLDRAATAGQSVALVLDGVTVGSVGADEMADDSLVLHATSFDFLRAVTGRRTGSEVRAMEWTGDPEPLLGTVWNQYGPLVG